MKKNKTFKVGDLGEDEKAVKMIFEFCENITKLTGV